MEKSCSEANSGQKNYPPFIDLEGSLPSSQETATGPYPEPTESSPYPRIVVKIIVKNILRSSPVLFSVFK
jgi:hypothetical protein